MIDNEWLINRVGSLEESIKILDERLQKLEGDLNETRKGAGNRT